MPGFSSFGVMEGLALPGFSSCGVLRVLPSRGSRLQMCWKGCLVLTDFSSCGVWEGEEGSLVLQGFSSCGVFGGVLSSQGFRLAVCLGEGGSCLARVFVLLCVLGRGDLV